MKVKDVIELACVFLGKQDILETSLFDQTQPDATDEQNAEINTPVR